MRPSLGTFGKLTFLTLTIACSSPTAHPEPGFEELSVAPGGDAKTDVGDSRGASISSAFDFRSESLVGPSTLHVTWVGADGSSHPIRVELRAARVHLHSDGVDVTLDKLAASASALELEPGLALEALTIRLERPVVGNVIAAEPSSFVASFSVSLRLDGLVELNDGEPFPWEAPEAIRADLTLSAVQSGSWVDVRVVAISPDLVGAVASGSLRDPTVSAALRDVLDARPPRAL